jgi:transposase-like protein
MEGRQRRSFTEEYKRQAAELVVSSGRSITSVAKELGLRDSVLRRWVEKLRRTRLLRSPGCARRTSGCAWSATF